MVNHPTRSRLPIGAGVRAPSGLLGEVIHMDSCPRDMHAVRFPTDRGPVIFWLPRDQLRYAAKRYADAVAWDAAAARGETHNTRKED